MNYRISAFLLLLITLSCSKGLSNSVKEGVFKAMLPCADCPGIDYSLNLIGDNNYILSTSYKERNADFVEKGTWSLEDKNKLIMNSEDGEKSFFEVINNDTILKLDIEGNRIKGEIAHMYKLVRK